MAGELLVNLFVPYFAGLQPEVKKVEKRIEETIFKSPFLTAQNIFSDILPSIYSDKFYALSLVGPQGKGKTFLAGVFATLAKQNDFLVVYAKAEDVLTDLEGWVQEIKDKLENEHMKNDQLCLVLDDMSYSTDSVSKKKSSIFKHFIADIRHVFKAKMFLIFISHRFHALPPMLRNSASWIFASMQAADRDDAMKIISKRKTEIQKLEDIYSFISEISIDGPKYGGLKFRDMEGNTTEFVWGKQDNPGDGRLMVSIHAGEIRIFNSRVVDGLIELDTPTYHVRYIPPPEPTEEEKAIKKAQEKIMKDEENRRKAIALTLELNNHDNLESKEII